MVIYARNILCYSFLPTPIYLFLYDDRYLAVVACYMELATAYRLWFSNWTTYYDYCMANILQCYLNRETH